MTTRRHLLHTLGLSALTLTAGLGPALAQPAPVTLLNVSYDPTRELYVEINQAF
ncbi:sulfate transporter subunit, partial [Hydrogenophaga sp. T2]